ncbi:MAG: GNAT family N-acetyltransferase [Elusimicrobia bacterium]|nr:GNAT family N-acetyltransferase [Elusimicrobiota bacterium]
MLEIAEDSWLSGFFGHGAFRLSAPWEAFSAGDLKALVEHRGGLKKAFYYAKVPTQAVGAVCRLNEAGFFTVDVNVTFNRSVKLPALPPSGCEVAKVECDGDLARGAVAIAGSCFKYSRFHLDPLVSPELAHRIKAEWIENYVRGKRGNGLYVAKADGKPAGFLAVIAAEEAGRKVGVIDLIGVASSAQGKGIGKSLTRFFVNEFRGKCDDLLVGTQAANVPSMRLYESCGFQVCKTAYVLHKHLCAA